MINIKKKLNESRLSREGMHAWKTRACIVYSRKFHAIINNKMVVGIGRN